MRNEECSEDNSCAKISKYVLVSCGAIHRSYTRILNLGIKISVVEAPSCGQAINDYFSTTEISNAWKI